MISNCVARNKASPTWRNNVSTINIIPIIDRAKESPYFCQKKRLDYRTIDHPNWASTQKENPPWHFGQRGECSKLEEMILETIYEARSVRASSPTAEQHGEICAVGCVVTIDIATSGSPCGEQACQVCAVAEPVVVEITWAWWRC